MTDDESTEDAADGDVAADDGAEPAAGDAADTAVAGDAAVPATAGAGTAPLAGDEPDEPAEAPPAPAPAAPVFTLMEVISVVFSLPSPSPIVHLREADTPFRSIEFPIGLPEAQSIAHALDHDTAARPTTHELLGSVLAASGTDVVAVRLTEAHSGTILAELDLMTPKGHVVLDCRPTDGIAVALRQLVPAPILCNEVLLDD